MKWKIERSSAHKYERTLQFFTFFPAIYSTYNGSARKKSTWIFSCARVRITTSSFSPGKYVHIYNRLARRKRIWRLCWFVAARISCGYILPMVDVNPAQIGTYGATWLWCNLRSQLARLMLYRQITNRQPHIILWWKNVWMYINFPWKNVMVWANIHMKNVNDGDFDTNMNYNMCMKVILLFIGIELRIIDKYIHLYHAYCYLHHLCTWWCRCICIWICKWICRCICKCIWYIILVIYYSIDICMCKW